MTIDAMILELMKLRTKHGKDARLLVNHSDAALPYHVPAENGCPSYISIESE